jgi:hypothetical protein
VHNPRKDFFFFFAFSNLFFYLLVLQAFYGLKFGISSNYFLFYLLANI